MKKTYTEPKAERVEFNYNEHVVAASKDPYVTTKYTWTAGGTTCDFENYEPGASTNG